MLPKLLLVTTSVLAPALCLAQSTPHLYVGASASMLSAYPFRSYNINYFGPAVTVGYQLNPRWAIQLGASLSHRNSDSDFGQTSYSDQYTRLTIPLLARYTFTNPAKPLHIDALFGGSWVRSMGHSTITNTYAAGNADVYRYGYGYNNVSIGIGPSVRYTLGTNVDLMASSLVQTDLTNGNAFDYYYLTTQLGIQYAFGR